MRLIEHLAARRIYYRRPLPTLPDILLIDIPPAFAGEGLALGRYYPVMLETIAEAHEFEAFLCEDRAALVAPALLDRRPSALRCEDIIFARYSPPTPDWPWLQLGCWPRQYAEMAEQPGDVFARGIYTIDVFADADGVLAAALELLATLGHQDIRLVCPPSGMPGHS
ncbi:MULTISPECIES: hypothetical protein [unclassified Novosphingobium]|nr:MULTISPECIES: hypothetical protein [unclassified Novosphingobium]MBB3650491.1 hypothetical protein [Novosphingobium sp. BK626]MBB3357042.1 hypothetical protein [Novosphingobium sp. BK256]MBB3373443.1 hypothetical protein [Novosphingobium sp. BK280]MBB3377812.1 hypothetical protein [Novosphingobium sp. BK258]MBB3418777.1 hypothetical protein [Novosphingobium sp. BK267]